MDQPLESLIRYMKIIVMRSSAPLFVERTAFNGDPANILCQLFTDALTAVVTSPHLLAPLYALYDHDSLTPGDFETPASRRVYYADHAGNLSQVKAELLLRFARTPIVVLFVDTPNPPSWAMVVHACGLEHTVIVEKRLVDIILADTPEACLFGFAVFYHEIAHLFRRWYLPTSSILPFAPKKIRPPGYKQTLDDRGEAGAFVEWAGLGGVTQWYNGQLYIQSRNLCHPVTTQEAQLWWNSKAHPHLVEYLEVARQSSLISRFLPSGNGDPFLTSAWTNVTTPTPPSGPSGPFTLPTISPSKQLSSPSGPSTPTTTRSNRNHMESSPFKFPEGSNTIQDSSDLPPDNSGANTENTLAAWVGSMVPIVICPAGYQLLDQISS